MAKKYRTDDIASLAENWGGASTNSTPSASDETNLLPYSGDAVQRFVRAQLANHADGIEGLNEEITKRAGFIAPMSEKVDGYYHLRGFADEAAWLEWASDKDTNAELLLFDVAIPISDEQGVITSVGLATASNQTRIVSIDGVLALKMKFTSQEYNPVTGTSTDTYEDGTLTLQRRTSSGSAWSTVATYNIASSAADGGGYVDIDISKAVGSGTCQLRCSVTGQQSGMTTTYVLFQEVVKTSLSLALRTEWQNSLKTSGKLSLHYAYTGAVSKTLVLTVSNADGNSRTLRYALGTAETTETATQFDITDSESDTVKLLTHGVKTVEAHLEVAGAGDEVLRSESVTSQVMYVTDTANTTPHLLVCNAVTSVENRTTTRLLQYAVYAPGKQTLPLTFKLVDAKTQKTEYFRYEDAAVPVETVCELTNSFEIDSTATSIAATMLFYSESTQIGTALSILVDNSADFAPTSGADFVLNPKVRSNSETARATVINAATGQTVAATFSGFGWVTDGWVTDDEGVKCLYVPRGRQLTIDYEAFSAFAGTKHTDSLAIEIEYKVSNITDEEKAVLRMCSYQANGNPLGLELRATEGCMMTVGKQVRLDQNCGWEEGKRTRLSTQLLYNLSASGQNYCKLCLDGVPQREFNYAETDTFLQYVNGTLSSEGIRIGGDGADIYVYSMRIYKTGLSSTQTRQDYMATLDTSAEKVAFRKANDILSNGLINYALAKEQYNVIVWTGTYPTYGNTKNDKFNGTLEVSIVGDADHSGTLYNMNVKGQGSSSMTYFWWNGQWGFNEGGYWVDGNGINRGAGYQLWAGLPLATKLVGKVNFASSPQSHKMGSCNLYHDAWSKICPNGITKTAGYENIRSAVPQKPFLFFVRETADSEPVFKSFMTFGPGKGDKPTFGYDKKMFPDYICIEGSDNDMAVVMGRVPWIDEDVTLDGEDWKYAGNKQFSLVFGDTAKYAKFRDAMQFVYRHYLNIEPYYGTLAELRSDTTADTNKHYWMTVAGDGYAKYDLYRYCQLTKTWVEAGLTKLSDGKYATLNINGEYGYTASGANYEAQNTAFKAARAAHFRQNAGTYFDLEETRFTLNFVRLVAASDNWCKNTYLYIDPTTGLIGWYQDDLDTIFKTDNVGKTRKPYYVEEHDKDDEGSYYWNGEGNALFNLVQAAFADELRAEMKTLLQTLASLSDDGTVMGAFEKYYFSTQEYFPAVAYAEVARLVYEAARVAYAAGKYTNGTDPITQSLGSQLGVEREWVKKRIAYLSSWCGYGEFGNADGISSSGSLNFRSTLTVAGGNPSYTFKVVPHTWLYPTAAAGKNVVYGERTKAGDSYTISLGQYDGNTNIFLNGINYLRQIGNFASHSLKETFALSGERLTQFEVSGLASPEFRPTAMTVAAKGLQSLVMHDVTTLTGTLDLSAQTRLTTIDLSGCTELSGVTLPATEYLTTLTLPENLTELTLTDMPNLTDLTVEGASRLTRLTIGAGVASSYDIFHTAYTQHAPLNYLRAYSVAWEGLTLAEVNYMAAMSDCAVTGKLTMGSLSSTVNRPSFAEVMTWIGRWGNINASTNALRIDYYKTSLTGIGVKGDEFLYATGTATYQVYASNTYGNDVASVAWTLAKNSYLTIKETKGASVVLNVNKLGDEDTAPTVKLTCTVTKTDGTTLSASMTIGAYPRKPHLYDLVFADGTWGVTANGKTVVGICFYVNPYDETDRRMFAVKNCSSSRWGLYSISGITLTDSPSYDCYNIASLTDIVSTGLLAGTLKNSTSYVEPSNYCPDGVYNSFSATQAAGEGIANGAGNTGREALTAELALLAPSGKKEGDTVPTGMMNTLKIIAHRNKILQDSGVGLAVPAATATATEATILENLIAAVQTANSGNANYQEYYYPAASRCYAYQPTVAAGETLAEKFKAHNWYLPSVGELARIAYLTAYDTDSERNIAKLAAQGLAPTVTSDWVWTSTELSRYGAWYVRLSDGYLNYNAKSHSLVVWAVAAF